MRNHWSTIVGFAILVVLMGAGAAQGLSGTNTVDSGDIINGQVTTPDIKTGAVTGSKILDGSVTKADLAASIHKAYFARVADNGTTATLIAGNATSAARSTGVNGQTAVHFPFDVSKCAITATVAIGPGSGSQFYNPFSFLIDHRTTAGIVYVDVRNASNTPVYVNFDLTLICP